MRHLDLQLIVGRRNEVGLTATAFKAGCRRHRLMQLLGTGCSICGAGALRTSRRAAGARCALSSQIGSDRDRDGASRGGDGAIPIGRERTLELWRYWWNRWGLRVDVRGGVNPCKPGLEAPGEPDVELVSCNMIFQAPFFKTASASGEERALFFVISRRVGSENSDSRTVPTTTSGEPSQ